MELAEVREGVLQQLQCLEATKMRMAEQKLAEQARLGNDLEVRLQAACATLDVSAGMACLDKKMKACLKLALWCACLGMAWIVAHEVGHASLGLLADMQTHCEASVTYYLHLVEIAACMTCQNSWSVSTSERSGVLAIHLMD